MNIFFVASIHGKNKQVASYSRIIDLAQALGHKVSADHILDISKEDVEKWDDNKSIAYHRKVIDGIRKADVIVAELSTTSTSVGYLISIALESGKPTIAMYSGDQEPHLLKTLEANYKFQLIRYQNEVELDKELASALEYAADCRDVRFNFFLPPSLVGYLDWISQKEKLPRSVYLRRLIEKDMRKNKDYTE